MTTIPSNNYGTVARPHTLLSLTNLKVFKFCHST
uniref:Uncharacterized protein n=1 Tax=Heterorhabditis bacteriophora TaxID=37862 RepID=A0A1I7WHW4_HETBA